MKAECAAAIFSVKDLEASLKFYKETLGFSDDFRVGSYAGVKYGAVCLHLTQDHPLLRAPGSGAVYIFCDEVDDYCAAITAKGAEVRTPPQDWPYGMRDFTAFDPDGNQLSFGVAIRTS